MPDEHRRDAPHMSFGEKGLPIMQPKAEANARVRAEAGWHLPAYVEIPRVFTTLRDAQKAVRAGGVVFLRSEHPLELRSFSGVFETLVLSKKTVADARETLTQTLARAEQLKPSGAPTFLESGMSLFTYIETYDILPSHHVYKAAMLLRCMGEDLSTAHTYSDATESELLGLYRAYHTHNPRFAEYCTQWAAASPSDIASKLSFSLWEGVAGDKVTVMRDAHKPHQYHIFQFGNHTPRGVSRYTCAVVGHGEHLSVALTETSDARDTAERALPLELRTHIIGTYELAHHFLHLENEVPIVECIAKPDGTVALLQTHLHAEARYTTPRVHIPESITEEREGWKKAAFVHGFTSGIERVTLSLQNNVWDVGTAEYGATRSDDPQTPATFEGMCSTYIAIKIPDGTTLVDTHGPVNQALMPSLSITTAADFLPSEHRDIPDSITVDIVSDGTTAYVRLVHAA